MSKSLPRNAGDNIDNNLTRKTRSWPHGWSRNKVPWLNVHKDSQVPWYRWQIPCTVRRPFWIFLGHWTRSGWHSDSQLRHQPNGPRLDWQSTRIFQCLIWVHLASLVWAISWLHFLLDFQKNMFSFFFYFLVFNKRSATGARLKHQFSFIPICNSNRPDLLLVGWFLYFPRPANGVFNGWYKLQKRKRKNILPRSAMKAGITSQPAEREFKGDVARKKIEVV